MSNRKRGTAGAPGGAMGDILEEVRGDGHLTKRQYNAGVLLLALLQKIEGSSKGLVAQMMGKVDGASFSPSQYAGAAADADLNRILKGLRPAERSFMKFLVVCREKPRGQLADWGKSHSDFKTNKTARAVTIGRLIGFLDAVADLLPDLHPVPG